MSHVAVQSVDAMLPEGPLPRMLAAVRRRTRTWIWIESLALLAIAAAAAFWGSLAFDWCVEPPAWVRAVLMAAAAGGLVWILVRRLVARLAVPLADEALAVIVERSHPEFRDGLSTAVGLSRGPRPDVDPQLLARTTAEAEALVGRVDPRRIFRHRSLSLLAAAALVAAGTVGLLAAVAPPVAQVWVRRSLFLQDEPWPRRTRLEVEGFVDGGRKVARGSDVDVIVHAGGAGGPPAAVDLRTRGSAGWRTVRMGTRGGASGTAQTFGHVLESVTEDLRLEVRGGDARLRDLRLVVVEPPALDDVEIRGTPPAYLGGAVRRPPVARLVALPRGSRVELACRATKPLAVGRLTVRPVGTTAGAEEALVGELAPGGPRTDVTGLVESLDRDLVVTLDLVDTDGLANREPITFTLVAVPDDPPRVAVRLRGISTAVTPRARLPIAGTITDDHAVAAAEVRLGWRPSAATATPAADAAAAETSRVVPLAAAAGGGPLVDLAGDRMETVPLEPLGLVPGSRLEVVVTARDACTLAGPPQTGSGDTWTLDVVAVDALQAMLEAREIVLRRRFEAAIGDLAQSRERLGPAADSDAPVRFGESVARATGETAEIAAAFGDIRLEFDNNGMLTPELQTRLVGQIADPLAEIATSDLPGLAAACRAAGADGSGPLSIRADDVLARMRAVLARMMELESFNQVIERLRGVIRAQEEIRDETLRRQRQRAREALE